MKLRKSLKINKFKTGLAKAQSTTILEYLKEKDNTMKTRQLDNNDMEVIADQMQNNEGDSNKELTEFLIDQIKDINKQALKEFIEKERDNYLGIKYRLNTTEDDFNLIGKYFN